MSRIIFLSDFYWAFYGTEGKVHRIFAFLLRDPHKILNIFILVTYDSMCICERRRKGYDYEIERGKKGRGKMKSKINGTLSKVNVTSA